MTQPIQNIHKHAHTVTAELSSFYSSVKSERARKTIIVTKLMKSMHR